MLKAVKFDVESYKQKLDKMTESELKDEWDKVVNPIRECYDKTEESESKNQKKQYTSSGIRF